jgi:hypothetical protein
VSLLAVLALSPALRAASVDRVTRLTAAPQQHARVDFVVVLQATWTDPFAAAEVRLDLELTEPSGRATVVPGYYEEGASGAASVWRVRYTPRQPGPHRGRMVLTTPGGRSESAPVEFTAAAAAPGARGFLRAGDPWCLRFDDGTPFRGLGENLGWESRSPDDSRHFKALHEEPRFNYGYLLGRLGSAGGNFFRTWMCPWNLPLEWPRVTETRRYADHPGSRFNPDAIARMDALVEMAEASGTYVMLALDAHIAFMGRHWDLNPYNRKNGGPAATPMDFFTDPTARARYRDRLRYLVARWGYSPHLAVWEFFNEIDHVVHDRKPDPIPDAVITAWHAEMGAELRRLDPYGRPVTTSISHRVIAGLDAVEALAFNQRHIYRNTDVIPQVIRDELRRSGKPYVIGEYGYEWDWNKDFNAFADRMDDDFKRGLWLGLFSPTPILPMSWWWEFFDERGVTAYFGAVRLISDRMLAAGRGEFAEIPADAGAARTLAVRCGGETFVYLHNPAATAIRVNVQLTDRRDAVPVAELFDPETKTWTPGPTARASAGGASVDCVSLQPGEIRILVLR